MVTHMSKKNQGRDDSPLGWLYLALVSKYYVAWGRYENLSLCTGSRVNSNSYLYSPQRIPCPDGSHTSWDTELSPGSYPRHQPTFPHWWWTYVCRHQQSWGPLHSDNTLLWKWSLHCQMSFVQGQYGLQCRLIESGKLYECQKSVCCKWMNITSSVTQLQFDKKSVNSRINHVVSTI